MNKTLAIIGSGHLGQQIAHYALSDGHYTKVIFIDDFAREKEKNGIPILGKIDDVLNLFKKKKFDELIIGIGYKHLAKRKEIFGIFEGEIPFGTIVHSSVWMDNTASIKEGSVIYPSCSLDANVVIDKNTIVNIGCTIAHDTKIGKHCFLSPRVAIAGFVEIEEQCIIGINSTIIDNIKIVKHTQLGGGAVVINNIIKKGLYVGNPSRFIK